MLARSGRLSVLKVFAIFSVTVLLTVSLGVSLNAPPGTAQGQAPPGPGPRGERSVGVGC